MGARVELIILSQCGPFLTQVPLPLPLPCLCSSCATPPARPWATASSRVTCRLQMRQSERERASERASERGRVPAALGQPWQPAVGQRAHMASAGWVHIAAISTLVYFKLPRNQQSAV